MIREATKPCSTCGVEYALSAFPKNRRQCRTCRQAYVRRWTRGNRARINSRQPKGSGAPTDHAAICRRLKEGALHREIAAEFGCVASTVKAIAARYGLQRTPLYVAPERPEAQIPADTSAALAMAVEAQRLCWDHYARNQGRKRTPYSGVTAEQVIDGITKDWRQRVRLMCEVLDMARER